MALQFNLMPPRPQKSFFPKAQKNSTANSYYQQRVTNRAVINEYQLLKDSGDPYNTNLGPPFIYQAAKACSTPACPIPDPPTLGDWVFYGYWLTGVYGYLSNDKVPLVNYIEPTSPVGVDDLGYQHGGSWNESFYIQFLPGWTTGLSIDSLTSVAFYNQAGEKVREYKTAGMDPSQFGLSAGGTRYFWWWPAWDNNTPGGPSPSNSPYSMLEEAAFWSSAVGETLTISWNGLPPQITSKKSSTPQMYQRFGSSDTYNDPTKDRLLRIKSNAIMNSQ